MANNDFEVGAEVVLKTLSEDDRSNPLYIGAVVDVDPVARTVDVDWELNDGSVTVSFDKLEVITAADVASYEEI